MFRKDGSDAVCRRLFTTSQEGEAVAAMQRLGLADVVLDLHNVLDTVDPATPLFDSPQLLKGLRVACCSYVRSCCVLCRPAGLPACLPACMHACMLGQSMLVCWAVFHTTFWPWLLAS